MLRQHSQLMVTLLVIADAVAVAVAWLLSYVIRFSWLPVDPTKGVPGLADKFLPMLPLVVAVHLVIFYRLRLYRPRREGSLFRETRDIVKAFIVAVVAVVVIDYALPASNKISRQFIVTYAVLGTTCFTIFRATVRVILRAARRRGWNRRTAAIIGSGRNAQRLRHALAHNDWTGIEVSYFVDDREENNAGQLHGVPVYGPLGRLRDIVEARPPDAVFIALPSDQAARINQVLSALGTSMADVRLVPDISPTYTMRPNVSELDGVPIMSLRQTPLYGWNAILKRAFDLAVGSFCLLIGLGPMSAIAGVIKLTSRGPILYRQRRMGLDGCEFTMLKFRTMRIDAEAKTGAVWATQDDPRRTVFGSFLRRTSLDELPNLFNVLAGHMSLVGPRPERPEFIRRFKDEIPRYMLRHKMKAGMTGYAQVRGLRGNTSLRKRIQHDVHYIRNWSLGLDIRILAQTLLGVWFSRHET
ncbi:MAG: undecaprenyl-phosphate glucose phosphotransferase [Planctomycetes bacterium]|nr:undecaprenyl-phosphate glucose phosphotransferase [Planctomycetota bacterium]